MNKSGRDIERVELNECDKLDRGKDNVGVEDAEGKIIKLNDEIERIDNKIAQLSEKANKLDDQLKESSKTPFEVVMGRPIALCIVVAIGLVIGMYLLNREDSRLKETRLELNQNIKDLRHEVLEYYNKGILAKIK